MTSRARVPIAIALVAILCIPGLVLAKDFVNPNQTIQTEIPGMYLEAPNPFGAGLIYLREDPRPGFETLGEIEHWPYEGFPAESFFDVYYRVEIDDFGGGGPLNLIMAPGEPPDHVRGLVELVPFAPLTVFAPPSPNPVNLVEDGGARTGILGAQLLNWSILVSSDPDPDGGDFMIDSFFDVFFDIELDIEGSGPTLVRFNGGLGLRRDITVPVPTLSQWSLIFLAGLLLLTGILSRRRIARMTA